MKKYEEQQKMIAETKDFIERFKGTYSKTFQVQSRVKMLEKLELIEVDEEDTSRLRLKFCRAHEAVLIHSRADERCGDVVLMTRRFSAA